MRVTARLPPCGQDAMIVVELDAVPQQDVDVDLDVGVVLEAKS